MLEQKMLVIYTLKSPKLLDCMYGTRYARLNNKTKRDYFLDLVSTITQTHDLSSYNKSKHHWKDTHEVSQGLEHDT